MIQKTAKSMSDSWYSNYPCGEENVSAPVKEKIAEHRVSARQRARLYKIKDRARFLGLCSDQTGEASE